MRVRALSICCAIVVSLAVPAGAQQGPRAAEVNPCDERWFP